MLTNPPPYPSSSSFRKGLDKTNYRSPKSSFRYATKSLREDFEISRTSHIGKLSPSVEPVNPFSDLLRSLSILPYVEGCCKQGDGRYGCDGAQFPPFEIHARRVNSRIAKVTSAKVVMSHFLLSFCIRFSPSPPP